MKKTFLSILFSAALVFILTSCMFFELPGQNIPAPGDTVDTQYAYTLAQRAGFKGTYEDFIEAISGADGEKGDAGRGIASVEVNSSGHLIIVYTDGVSVDAGVVSVNGDIIVSGDENKRAVNEALLASVSVWADSGDGDGSYFTGAGTIFKIDKESGTAYIITNNHVIYNSEKGEMSNSVSIFLYGQEGYTNYAIPAECIGSSFDFDIAVLKVSESELLKNSSARSAVFADSDKVTPFDTAIAIGNPMSDGLSVTVGKVSVENEPIRKNGYDGAEIEINMMRVDTPVNEGNSGGGLFDKNGAFMGVVTLKLADDKTDNVAYALPSNLALSLAENIIKSCEAEGNGYAVKPIFGITVQEYEAGAIYDAVSGELTKYQHSEVIDVIEGSAADGVIRSGDRLVSMIINGKEYKLDRSHKIVELPISISLGDEVSYKLLRGGEEITVKITLEIDDFVEIH